MTTADYLERIERPHDPAPFPTWRLGTDHVVLRIPEDVAAHLGHDLRLMADDDTLEPLRFRFLAWWFANVNPTTYGWGHHPNVTPEHEQLLALGELERILDTLTNDTISATRRLADLPDTLPWEDETNQGWIVTVHWMDVVAFLWRHFGTSATWRYGPHARAADPKPPIIGTSDRAQRALGAWKQALDDTRHHDGPRPNREPF